MSDQFHQLSAKWTISEKYTALPTDEYKKSIVDICSFSSVEEFAFLMKQTIYAKLTDLFSEPQKSKLFKNFSNEASETQIEAIQFFKNDIKPMWEDPQNEKGGDIQFEVPVALLEIYDQLYSELLFEIIGQGKEELRHINGLRVLDKINAKAGNCIRVELWLDINPQDNNEQIAGQIKLLDDWIVTVAKKYQLTAIKLKYQSHKK